MITTITADNIPHAYEESYWALKANARSEDSRNGPVLAVPGPSLLTITNPLERVLFDPERNCNPFFHVMETIWMFAGEAHVGFPAKFNSTYVNYAEADGLVHGAYGKRWRAHFQPKEIGPRYLMDQIQVAIAMLKKDPESRRVVLSMWDATEDLGAEKRDLPCNTHIYFRTKMLSDEGSYTLDMTVCNRSNDLLWGMLGANIVHMTYLHELIAHGAGMLIGTYRVFTNNLHVYTESEVGKKFLQIPALYNPYALKSIGPYPLFQEGEAVENFLEDCEVFVDDNTRHDKKIFNTKWMNEVAVWMYLAYQDRLQKKGDGLHFVDQIRATDWRLACRQWVERKTR